MTHSTRPTLRTFSDIDMSRPLLALDVDGVLNRMVGGTSGCGPTTRTVTEPNGRETTVDFFPDRIEALDKLTTDLGVNIGWNTSWGHTVDGLIEQAFDGMLAGGFILVRPPKKQNGFRRADWKWTGLRSHLQVFPTPTVWADDEEIAIARQFDPRILTELADLAPLLPFDVDEAQGLTWEMMDQMAAFYTAHGAASTRR